MFSSGSSTLDAAVRARIRLTPSPMKLRALSHYRPLQDWQSTTMVGWMPPDLRAAIWQWGSLLAVDADQLTFAEHVAPVIASTPVQYRENARDQAALTATMAIRAYNASQLLSSRRVLSGVWLTAYTHWQAFVQCRRLEQGC